MKIFQSIQKYLAMLGICSPHIDQKYSINAKNLIALLSLSIPIFAGDVPQFYLAESFDDYTNTFYATLTMLVNTFDFSIHISVAGRIYKFIENFERIIQTSGCNLNSY